MSTILILASVGILALLVELVVPGGILGAAGGICLVAAAVLSFVEYGFLVGLIVSLILGGISLGLLWAWMRHFHRLPFTRDLILLAPGSPASTSEDSPDDRIGETGIAITDLNPSGRIECGTTRLDGIAEAHAIPRGQPIVIVRRSGPGWIVREKTT